MTWSHQKPPDSAQQVPSTAKCWQGLAAGVGVLPSGLWQRSDSGTPFTLEEDPPCGEICGSAQELLISDGNHKEEPYKIAAKLEKNPTKNTDADSVYFSTPILVYSCFLKVNHHCHLHQFKIQPQYFYLDKQLNRFQ